MRLFQMRGQIVLDFVAFVAELADVRPRFRVILHVPRQGRGVLELFPAQRARAIRLVAVRPRVIVEFFLRAKGLITEGAREVARGRRVRGGSGDGIGVAQMDVSLELRFGREAVATQIARVRLLTRVLSHVTLEPTLIREAFAAKLFQRFKRGGGERVTKKVSVRG